MISLMVESDVIVINSGSLGNLRSPFFSMGILILASNKSMASPILFKISLGVKVGSLSCWQCWSIAAVVVVVNMLVGGCVVLG